ncbi:GNAT family N-acetyltransferase [Cohnella lubricantis]|uniref:GNAT family N-acetyltransferase n=1 Tax=Cohnella lubricantis TaxID=2163172 RepID=A0A841THK4_9BACL|nr:GNAT family N-acetyltransferase [Cohnella lubricantis]MBB6677941.1 GNAT family N-acetyltransferase [Cohnella lubricantis]MBP2119991.1 ribosomal protein S18 acetylase RimI-like enzyme [Cohnella lubricantis]
MVIERLDLSNRETAELVWSLQHAAYRIEANLIGVTDLPPLRETVADLEACAGTETFWGCWTEDGELAAAVSAETGDEAGSSTVCRVMVHPDYFRQGLASKLLSVMMAEYAPGSDWDVTAEVRNEPALSLYAKLGFLPAETFCPAPGIAMVRMRKPASAEAET